MVSRCGHSPDGANVTENPGATGGTNGKPG
jgi:hypothetical protein